MIKNQNKNLHLYLCKYFELSEEYARSISTLFATKNLPSGEFLFKKNKYNVPLAFIQQGFIRIYDNNNGKEITQWISSPGDFVTDLASLFFRMPNRWNAVCVTDVELFYLENSNYNKMTELVSNWNELEKKLMAKCFRVLEERVYSFLSLSAKDRYAQLLASNGDLINTIPLQYLASMLGMSPETLSRIRANHS